MGILANENMLRKLIIIVSIVLLMMNFALAKEEKDSFDEAINSNPDLKKKTQEIEDTLHSRFADKENSNQEIILFIDPDNGFSDDAVNTLVGFKKDHPDWKVRGVIITALKDFKQKLFQKRDYFSNNIEFSVDIWADLAKRFNIHSTPAYIIAYKGRYYKVTGQPDLNEIISKLNE